MNKASLVILVIIGVLLFLVGGGLGIFYQAQKDASQIKKAETIDILSSSVIPSIVAYGQVTKIQGRNITLTFDNESIIVPIAQNAPVYSFNQSAGQASSVQKQGDISQIKSGDYLNISIGLSQDGKIEGATVVILPPVGSSVQ